MTQDPDYRRYLARIHAQNLFQSLSDAIQDMMRCHFQWWEYLQRFQGYPQLEAFAQTQMEAQQQQLQGVLDTWRDRVEEIIRQYQQQTGRQIPPVLALPYEVDWLAQAAEEPDVQIYGEPELLPIPLRRPIPHDGFDPSPDNEEDNEEEMGEPEYVVQIEVLMQRICQFLRDER